MSPAAGPPQQRDPRQRWDFSGEEAPVRIPPALAAIGLGGLALLISLGGLLPQTGWLAWFDLPFAVLSFIACALLMLGSLRRAGRVLPGLLAAFLAVLVSAAHLLLGRGHPWAG